MPNSAAQRPLPTAEGAHLILYDGVCGLCSRFNQFVIAYDRSRLFHFASLQSAAGRAALQRFGADCDELTTFYVLANYRSASPAPLSKSRAALFVATRLGWPWRAASLFYLVPKALAEQLYDLVARHRYRMFGRYERCPLPDPAHRDRFIDS